MYKNSIVIFATIIVIFLSGLTTGLLTSKNRYQELTENFFAKVQDVQDNIRQTEFINKKLRLTFETVSARNTELNTKVDLIQKKELEIARLTQQIAHEKNINEKIRLKELLQQKRSELAELRKNYSQKNEEIASINEEISAVNKLLKLNSERIVDMEAKLQAKEKLSSAQKQKILKEKERIKEQIDFYELGGIAEAKGDSIKGFRNRWDKEEHYIEAFNYYMKSEAVFNLKRIAAKVKDKKLRKEMEEQIKNMEAKIDDY